MPADVNSILVVRLGAMGDIIHSLPGVALLRQSFPDAQITWVTEPEWVALLEGNGIVDRFVLFRKQNPRSWKRTREELRGHGYDLAIDFQGLLKSALVARAASPKQIVGFASGVVRERPAGILYSKRIPSRAVHVVDQAIDLAVGAGAARGGPARFPLPMGIPEGLLPDGPFVLACPLAGWTSKQWPVVYYERLAELLRARFGIPLVLNGPPGRVPDVKGTLKHESGIAGLIHATRQAALVVGVDSGPLHLAAALEKSGVAIYGPTDPVRNGPYSGDFEVFREPGARTTHRRGATVDRSMFAIHPEAIMAALEKRWTRISGPTASVMA